MIPRTRLREITLLCRTPISRHGDKMFLVKPRELKELIAFYKVGLTAMETQNSSAAAAPRKNDGENLA